MELKNKMLILPLVLVFLLGITSCREELADTSARREGVTVKLRSEGYEGETESRMLSADNTTYDYLKYYIMDAEGRVYKDAYCIYYPESSEIKIDGLKEGEYTFLVLGIKGDFGKDKAVVSELQSIHDTWIKFPDNLDKPLCADYYFSSTPFSVKIISSGDGMKESTTLPAEIKQKRIMGRIDFDFHYDNPYIRTSLSNHTATLNGIKYYTEFRADSVFEGNSEVLSYELNLLDEQSFRFLPAYDDGKLSGDVVMDSRSYTGQTFHQKYSYEQFPVTPNKVNHIHFKVVHPEGNSGVMYYTLRAYKEAGFEKILQDDEHKDVYADRTQRFFNTAKPLQLSFQEDGTFHMRFYSPRDAGDMKVRLKIPKVSSEYLDFAYFDTIPAFADIFVKSPVLDRSVTLRSESGKIVQIPQLTVEQLSGAEIKVVSSDPYWEKLASLKYGRNLYFGLYGGDPDAPDGGGGISNWRAIRPIHCREAIAFFINYTYMVGMQELEDLIRKNPDSLWDDSERPVTPDSTLMLMRREYTMEVGLVSNRNGVAGMASPSVFGVTQPCYFNHYNDTGITEIFFHELGHSYGFFGHKSSFTLGPWAWTLMNNFYVDHIKDFPIDSPKYLDSWNNPHRYAW